MDRRAPHETHETPEPREIDTLFFAVPRNDACDDCRVYLSFQAAESDLKHRPPRAEVTDLREMCRDETSAPHDVRLRSCAAWELENVTAKSRLLASTESGCVDGCLIRVLDRKAKPNPHLAFPFEGAVYMLERRMSGVARRTSDWYISRERALADMIVHTYGNGYCHRHRVPVCLRTFSATEEDPANLNVVHVLPFDESDHALAQV